MPDFSSYMPLILVVGGVVGLLILLGLIAKNYFKIPPNKVAVFYGKKHGDKGYKVVTGGSKFKIPIVEDVEFMDMAAFQLHIDLNEIPNKDGVLVNVAAIATCKISSEANMLMAAVERFLGKSPNEVHSIVKENLEGQLRAVVGTMTVEGLIQDRETLNSQVKKEADGELEKIGVKVDILAIQSITDPSGYIDALGKKRTAEVMRDAVVGKAEADRDAKKDSTTAEKEGAVTAAQNEAMTAEAEKERDVKKAKYEAEVKKEQARAEQAHPLATAQAKQEVVKEEQKVEEERARAEVKVQEQKAAVAAKAEEIKQVIPAGKTAEAVVKQAEGEKQKRILESEGDKAARINAAEAEKAQLENEGAGEASKISAVGRARGEAIQAELEGEAAGIMKKAAAYKALDGAAQTQMILEKLPGILREIPPIMAAIAQPMSAIDKVVVIENGGGAGGGNQTGVQKFVGNVPGVLTSLFNMAREAGFDPTKAFTTLGLKPGNLFDDSAALPATSAESAPVSSDEAGRTLTEDAEADEAPVQDQASKKEEPTKES